MIDQVRALLPDLGCERLGAGLVATEELPFDQALTVFQEGRGAGLTPIVVAEEAFGALEVTDHASALPPAPFFADRGVEALERGLEAALDRLGEVAERDPMEVLHRLDGEDLGAIEQGDGVDLDFGDLWIPDDVREAHAIALADRRTLLDTNRGGMVLVRPVRTWDEETALAEIVGGPSRVVFVPSSSASGLVHLGFGGFNDCPVPEVHAGVWGQWGRQFGAEVVFVERDRLVGIVARPPSARAELVRFVAEMGAYDRDLLDNGPLALAGWVVRNTSIGFWWD